MNFVHSVELVSKRETKVRDGIIQINYDSFSDPAEFKAEIFRVVRLGFKYSLLVRTSYVKLSDGSYTQYKMLGEQVGFTYNSHEDFDSFVNDYHNIIVRRLKDSADNYDYRVYDIINLQFLVFVLDKNEFKPKVNKFDAESVGAQKDLVNVSSIKDNLKQINIFEGLTNSNPLKKKLLNNSVKSIFLDNDVELIVDETINKYNNNTSFPKETNFYCKIIDSKPHIISILDTDGVRDVRVYSMSGILVNKAVFEYTKNGKYTRKMGNVKLHVDKTGVYRKDIEIKLGAVYPYKITGKVSKMIQPNWRIGSMDLETYKDGDISKVYSLGFYTKNDLKMYYIEKNLNSDDLIIKCLDDMLVENYNGYTFYIHNLTNYDIYFLFRVIISRPDKYKCVPNFRDDDIIGVKITSMKNTRLSIRIVDSYNMLKSDLNKLCVTFDTPVKKSYFPYDFVNKNTLFYLGDKPEFKFYNKIDNDVYNNIEYKNWSTEKETLGYLEADLKSLFSVMEQFIKKIYIDYHIHATKSMTISSLAMDIYLRKFYKSNIPLIKQKSIYNDIKHSYFGGITEVYKPYGKNLYYYDVNSLYPYAALNDMPGLNCVYSDNLNIKLENFDGDLFGFYYCKVKAADKYIGLLPFRSDLGLLMGVGTYEGWYFSEELKYAWENGYDITIIKGYSFNRNSGVFNDYVNHMYSIKSNTSDGGERQIVKSLLNNLLGRFGLDINKYVTSLVDDKQFRELIQTRKFRGIKFVEDKILLSYEKDINKDICDSHDIDYKSLINDSRINTEKLSEESYHDVSVAISSAVTSYARIFMNKVKMSILNKGGSIYYTDTDSIVTDTELDNDLVGCKLGQFKLEHIIKEGYFISNKTYSFTTDDNKIIIRNKGVDSGSVDYHKFNSLYLGQEVEAIRYHTDKNYTLGSVTLHNKNNIVLSPNSYTKRVKIYRNNLWIDTKPIQINQYHKTSEVIKKTCRMRKRKLFKYIFLASVSSVIISVLLLSLGPEGVFVISDIPVCESSECLLPNFENTSLQSKERNVFSWFLDLFNRNQQQIVWNKSNYDYFSESINVNKEPLEINILDKVRESHLNNLINENIELKNRISELMIKDLRSNIDKLDRIRLINSIIQEIDYYNLANK